MRPGNLLIAASAEQCCDALIDLATDPQESSTTHALPGLRALMAVTAPLIAERSVSVGVAVRVRHLTDALAQRTAEEAVRGDHQAAAVTGQAFTLAYELMRACIGALDSEEDA